jgi:hypothetical protein
MILNLFRSLLSRPEKWLPEEYARVKIWDNVLSKFSIFYILVCSRDSNNLRDMFFYGWLFFLTEKGRWLQRELLVIILQRLLKKLFCNLHTICGHLISCDQVQSCDGCLVWSVGCVTWQETTWRKPRLAIRTISELCHMTGYHVTCYHAGIC